MVTEAYVSFEVAKLLKGKGFDGICRAYYDNGEFRRWYTECTQDSFLKESEVGCPTHQVAMAWLREKGIRITMDWHTYNNQWYVSIIGKANAEYGMGHFRRYEDGVEKALKFSLINLV